MLLANPSRERSEEDRERRPSPHDRRVTRVKDNLRSNPKLSTADLAKSVGMSRSRLDVLFKSQIGVSLGDYIRNSRLELAREFLAKGDLTVKEIADKIGYEHSSSFVRSFKGKFGITPAAYRRSGRKEK